MAVDGCIQGSLDTYVFGVRGMPFDNATKIQYRSGSRYSKTEGEE